MEMNMNTLVPAIWARSAMLRDEMGSSDLGVAASQIRNNIRHGEAIDPVEGIPAQFIPDWKAWHDYEQELINADANDPDKEESEKGNGFVQLWAAMNDRRQELYFDLCKLWAAEDYQGMINLMNAYTPMPL